MNDQAWLEGFIKTAHAAGLNDAQTHDLLKVAVMGKEAGPLQAIGKWLAKTPAPPQPTTWGTALGLTGAGLAINEGSRLFFPQADGKVRERGVGDYVANVASLLPLAIRGHGLKPSLALGLSAPVLNSAWHRGTAPGSIGDRLGTRLVDGLNETLGEFGSAATTQLGDAVEKGITNAGSEAVQTIKDEAQPYKKMWFDDLLVPTTITLAGGAAGGSLGGGLGHLVGNLLLDDDDSFDYKTRRRNEMIRDVLKYGGGLAGGFGGSALSLKYAPQIQQALAKAMNKATGDGAASA